MLNIKEIAATLAILGSGTLMVGCEKDAPATETPGAADGATPEASCGEKKDGSCGEKKDGSCGEGKTPEASCGEKPE